MKTISKSEFKTMMNCPKQYYYQYVEKIPYGCSPEMTYGTQIHALMNHFFDNDFKSIEEMDKWGSPNYAKFPHLMYFVAWQKRRFDTLPPDLFKPVFREKRIDDEDSGLRGIIDAAYLTETGHVRIVEYKPKPPASLTNLRQETAFYTLLANSAGHKTGKVGFYFYKTGTYIEEDLKTITVNALNKNIEKVKTQIQNKDFKCRPSQLCAWCAYSEMCDFDLED